MQLIPVIAKLNLHQPFSFSNGFTVTFNQFNVSLLNTNINFIQKILVQQRNITRYFVKRWSDFSFIYIYTVYNKINKHLNCRIRDAPYPWKQQKHTELCNLISQLLLHIFLYFWYTVFLGFCNKLQNIKLIKYLYNVAYLHKVSQLCHIFVTNTYAHHKPSLSLMSLKITNSCLKSMALGCFAAADPCMCERPFRLKYGGCGMKAEC